FIQAVFDVHAHHSTTSSWTPSSAPSAPVCGERGRVLLSRCFGSIQKLWPDPEWNILLLPSSPKGLFHRAKLFPAGGKQTVPAPPGGPEKSQRKAPAPVGGIPPPTFPKYRKVCAPGCAANGHSIR